MIKRTLFHQGTIYGRARPHEDAWLLVERERITDIGWDTRPPDIEAQRIDLQGRSLVPGFIDLHAHGAEGHDTMDATPDALRHMAHFYARHGVTAFLATTMSAPRGETLAALDNAARVARQGTGGATLLGVHLEGPYLNAERCGAQNRANVRPPEAKEFIPFLSTGIIRLITLAPELPGNQAFTSLAVERGVAVAMGHTQADYEMVHCAIALGATQVTHIFNGMDPLHHRKPGAVCAALNLDALYCQIIADGVHVHPPVLALALRAKGTERVILITDAMRGTGMPDGEYELGDVEVTLREGVARTRDGSLAGSTLTMERALDNIMAAGDLDLAETLPMATQTPAQALKLKRKGSIAVGMDADLVVLDEAMNVILTMVEGEIVHRA